MNAEPSRTPHPTGAESWWVAGAGAMPGVRDLSPAGFTRALFYLALLGLVIRLGFFIEHSHSPSFAVPTLDQKYYDTAARMILAGEDLHALHGYKPLLYPLQLAACYRLGGGWGIDLAILLQHLLGVATGVLVAWLGAKLFRHRLAGIIGGVLFLIAPLPLCFEGELLVEATYTFLICLALLAHWLAVERRGWSAVAWWLAAGGLVALAAQERSNILVFAAVYPLLAVWRCRVACDRNALLPLLGLAGLLAVMLFWGLINFKQSDHFQLMPGAGGVNLYLGNKRTATGMTAAQEKREAYTERYEDPMEVWAREEYATAMRAQGLVPQDNPAAISSYWTHRAIEEIRADPGRWVKLMVKKTWLMAWNAEVPNNKAFAFEQQDSFWLRWLPVRWVWLFALAPIGFWAALKFGSREPLFLLLVFLLFYSAGVILFFISDRYRYPLWPALSVLAGGAVLVLYQALARRKLVTLAWMLAVMGIMAAISLPNWFAIRLPNFARDYLFRSIAWYDKGHYAEALADVDASLKLDATDASAWQERGNALLGLQRPAEACLAYQKALQASPGEATTWNNFGAALDALGKTEAALSAYQHATQCQPPSRNALLGITFIRLRTGQLDLASEALAQYEKSGSAPDAISLELRSLIERGRSHLQTAADLDHQARTLDAAAAQWAVDQINRTPVK